MGVEPVVTCGLQERGKMMYNKIEPNHRLRRNKIYNDAPLNYVVANLAATGVVARNAS